MSWTPTKGQKLADEIVQRLCGAAPAVGATTTPLFAWHMMDVIAKAIDQALADGAEQGAMEGMVGVTLTTATSTGAYSAHYTNGNGLHSLSPIHGASANPDDYSELPMYKGATAYDQLNDPHVVPLDDHMPDAPASVHANGPFPGFEPPAYAEVPFTPPPEAPKKRRGRPPGSKAKAAKPAKKRKSAKAIRAELYPVEAPVAETVAATVTEAPAEAQTA